MAKLVKSCVLWTALLATTSGCSEELGSVDTKFNLLSPDDSIKVEVFDDPKIAGVACYLSAAQRGGVKGAMGIAEDTSDASIDCRQVGPVRILESLDKGEPVFRKRRSLIFKRLHVIRFCDTSRNTIVYMVYSDKIIEGSPKNSISAVPIARWTGDQQAGQVARCTYSS